MSQHEVDDAVRRFAAKAKVEDDNDVDPFDPNAQTAKKRRRKKPLVDWGSFNGFIGVLIFANAISIGFETDAAGKNEAMWYTLELMFVMIFLLELIFRLRAHGWNFFTNVDIYTLNRCKQVIDSLNWWNIMDLIIVAMSILDSFILGPLGLAKANLRLVQMLRFARIMRLVRLIRLFKIFKELWLVASGLLDSLRTLLWVCLFLFVMLYICATYAAFSIGKDEERYNEYYRQTGWDHEVYFATVMRSVFTLFQVVTLDNWSDEIVRHVMEVQPAMLFFFMAIVMFASFGLLNVIIGVVVENTIETAAKDLVKEKKQKEYERVIVINHLRDIFEEADTDGSGTLSINEVCEAVQKPHVYHKLRMIEFPVDEPDELFKLLDYDDSGELTIDEFITGCVRMKGNAKSKDLLVAQVAMATLRKHCERFDSEMATLKEKMEDLVTTVRHMTKQGEHAFLNSQEYRVRHPDFMSTKMPVMSEGQLRDAPWEDLAPRLLPWAKDRSVAEMKTRAMEATLEPPPEPPSAPLGQLRSSVASRASSPGGRLRASAAETMLPLPPIPGEIS